MTTEPDATGPGELPGGTAVLMTWISPVRGRSEALLHWLDDIHIPEVQAAVPAILRSDRFTECHPSDPASPTRHLTVHEFAARDMTAVAAGIDAAVADGRIGLSPDLDLVDAPPVQQWHLHGRRYLPGDGAPSTTTTRHDPGADAGAAHEETR